MSSQTAADSYLISQGLYGGFDMGKQHLVIVVEALTEQQASQRVDQVKGLLRIAPEQELLIAKLTGHADGVPTFLRAFFEMRATQCQYMAPSSSSVH
jgi:hypothetical protein